jgi:hypothetical protein
MINDVAMRECVKLRKLLSERFGSSGFKVTVDRKRNGDAKLLINSDRIQNTELLQFLRDYGHWHFVHDGKCITGYVSHNNHSLAAFA